MKLECKNNFEPILGSSDMVSVDLINVTPNEPTAVENKKRKHVEDTSTSTSTKLKKSRPLLDPLMHDTVGKRTKKDKEDGSENEDWSEERTEDEDWGEERTDNIDGELEDMFEADDTVSSPFQYKIFFRHKKYHFSERERLRKINIDRILYDCIDLKRSVNILCRI